MILVSFSMVIIIIVLIFYCCNDITSNKKLLRGNSRNGVNRRPHIGLVLDS